LKRRAYYKKCQYKLAGVKGKAEKPDADADAEVVAVAVPIGCMIQD